MQKTCAAKTRSVVIPIRQEAERDLALSTSSASVAMTAVGAICGCPERRTAESPGRHPRYLALLKVSWVFDFEPREENCQLGFGGGLGSTTAALGLLSTGNMCARVPFSKSFGFEDGQNVAHRRRREV